MAARRNRTPGAPFRIDARPVGWYSLLLFRRRERPAAPMAVRHRSRCSAVHGIREDWLLSQTTVENVSLGCRAHDVGEAALYFGIDCRLLVQGVHAAYGVELGPDRFWARGTWVCGGSSASIPTQSGASVRDVRAAAGPVREQPHFVLGPKSRVTREGPAARSGAPRSRPPASGTLRLADLLRSTSTDQLAQDSLLRQILQSDQRKVVCGGNRERA